MKYSEILKLNKKISLVTGGAGGIGSEICKALLDAGSKVILADIDSKKSQKVLKEIKKTTGNDNINFFQVDTTSEKSIRALSNYLIKQYKVPKEKITVIPNIVDTGHFIPLPKNSENQPKSFKMDGCIEFPL